MLKDIAIGDACLEREERYKADVVDLKKRIYVRDTVIVGQGKQIEVLKSIIKNDESLSELNALKLRATEELVKSQQADIKKLNRKVAWTKTKGTIQNVLLLAAGVFIAIKL